MMVAGMSLGGRRQAGSAHTKTARKKGLEALPRQRCLGENGKAGWSGRAQQWVRAVAEDDRVNVAPSHLPRRRGSGWICDQR